MCKARRCLSSSCRARCFSAVPSDSRRSSIARPSKEQPPLVAGTAAQLRKAGTGQSPELSLDRVPLLRDFTADQVERLRSWLEPVAWPAGHVVFRHGDPGSSLYLVTRGRASVHLRHDDGGIRLVTFAAGAVFGELALLDRGPRSATITADEDLTGFGLSEASFTELCHEQPDIAIKLLSALGRELSVRLRYANMTIQQLES